MLSNVTNTEKKLKESNSILIRIADEIKTRNHLNLMDINISLEDSVLKMLNLLEFGNFKNANVNGANQKGFDLYDDEKGIFVQVTSDTTAEKVKSTLKSVGKEKYSKIIFIYLCMCKPKRQKNTFKDFKTYDFKSQEYDFSSLLNTAYENNMLNEFYDLLESEFNVGHPTLSWLSNVFEFNAINNKEVHSLMDNISVDKNVDIKSYLLKEKNVNFNRILSRLRSMNSSKHYERVRFMDVEWGDTFSGEHTREELKEFVEKLLELREFIIQSIEDYFESDKTEESIIQACSRCLEYLKNAKVKEAQIEKFYTDIVSSIELEMEVYTKCRISNCFLLHGETGCGKTHFVFDLCEYLLSKSKECYMVIGRNIYSSLEEIKNYQEESQFDLHKICSYFNSKDYPTYIVIDGVNESDYLIDQINEIIKHFTNLYKNIKFVVTVRTEFVDDFEMTENHIKFEINKFSEFNIQQVLRNYEIEHASLNNIELLSNPAYLLMYCESNVAKSSNIEMNSLRIIEAYIKYTYNKFIFSIRDKSRYIKKIL